MSTHPTRRTILFAGAVTTLGHRAGWAQENYRTYRLGILSSAETNNRQVPGLGRLLRRDGQSGRCRRQEPDRRLALSRVPGADRTRSHGVGAIGSRRPAPRRQHTGDNGGTGGDPDDPVGRHGRRHGRKRAGPSARPSRRKPDRRQPPGDRTRRQAAGDPDGAGAGLPPHGRARRPRRDRTAATRCTAKRCRIAWGRAVDLSGARREGYHRGRRHSAGRRRHGTQRAGLTGSQRQSQDHIGSNGRASPPRHVSMAKEVGVPPLTPASTKTCSRVQPISRVRLSILRCCSSRPMPESRCWSVETRA